MRESFRIIVARCLLLTALLMIVLGNTVSAGQVVAVLNTDQTKKSTACLGNTTGKYQMVGCTSTTSKHAVEYYLLAGEDSSKLSKQVDKFSWSKSSFFKNKYTVSTKYTVAKATMYGNKKSNPKKDNYANVILSNIK